MCKKRKFKPLACGFHSHADQSLDGGSTVKAKLQRAVELCRPADVLTDHGIMSGLASHWKEAKKLQKKGNNIQSIHGIEAYLIDESRPPKVYKNGKIVPVRMHLTIHFKTARAYRYFCKLTPIMEERAPVVYGNRKPLLKLEELYPISGEITLGSGCLMGPVQQNILRGRSDLAEKMYLKLREIAGPGNFFAEVFPHIITHNWEKPKRDKSKKIIEKGYFKPITEPKDRGDDAIDPPLDLCKGVLDIQKDPNAFVIHMATKYGDPIVISLDDHYGCEDDRLVQESRLGNGQENWKFYGSYASHSSDKCAELLHQQLDIKDSQIEEWIDNSYQFIERFKDYDLESKWLLPSTDMVYNIDTPTEEKAWELVKKHGRMPSENDPMYETYKKRYDYEISVLKDNGEADFLPYFFVIEDAVDWGKKNGHMPNTRGSAGGSLVIYLFGISITDPIKYNLPFERMLTIGRIKSGSLPDIDTDWGEKEPIFGYIKEKYGDQMALIATNVMMRLKTSILDAERATTGEVDASTSKLCVKLKGAEQGQTDKDWLYGYTDKTTGEHVPGFWENDKNPVAQELREYAEKNPEIWKMVQKCVGIIKTRGIHAGGVVITPGPVQNHMPLIFTKKGFATAYDMKGVEDVGGVKYDFLGVKTLLALAVAMDSIEKVEGVRLDWKEFPHEDEVYSKIIHKGQLASIFQLNTDTMRPYVERMRPKNITDIAIIEALVRPGALNAPSPDPSDNESVTAVDYYISCRNDSRDPYYIHQDLEPILKDTYGVIVFQEQALEIFREIGGYTYEQAEVARRGIGKKIKELLEQCTGDLRRACLSKGWTEDQADRLIDSIMASARYSFNKAHAVSYAIVAYNCCYLKHFYKKHFWKGVLTTYSDKHDKLNACLSECRHLLLPVDAQKSRVMEWTIEKGGIRPPMMLLKGCGLAGVEKLNNFIKTLNEEFNNE